MMKKDASVILYRPELNNLTGSALASILLHQIIYWWEKNGSKPFYKFFSPSPKQSSYREGDSWQEELGLSRHELDTALARIGKKIGKGDGKKEALKSNFVIYWTDSDRKTWFEVNESLLNRRLALLYTPNAEKRQYTSDGDKSQHMEDAESGNTSLTETTAETTPENTTEKDADAKKSASLVVEKPSVLVDGKPEYSVGGESPDATARNTTSTVTNRDDSNPNSNGDDPGGLFANVPPPPPRQKHTREELLGRYAHAQLSHLAMYSGMQASEWADETDVRLARVLECFSKTTGLRRPLDKRTVNSWRSEARHWLEAYKTSEHFEQVMDIYAERKRQGRYKFDITSPYSLHNTLWAIESELMSRGEGSDPNVITITDTGGQMGVISGSSGQDTIRIHDTVRPI